MSNFDNNVNERSFNLNGRTVRINPDVFKEKTEKEIYQFFFKNSNNNFARTSKLLNPQDIINNKYNIDFEADSKNIITENEIKIFVDKIKSQNKKLKNITEEDLYNFFEKVIEHSPTFKESTLAQLKSSKYTNEKGEKIISDEFVEHMIKTDFLLKTEDVTDNNNNVKKGFEILDLNEDGKLDKLEVRHWNLAGIYNITKNLDDIINTSSKNGVITSEDKMKVYKQLENNANNRAYESLATQILYDENGNNIITQEVKNLFSINKKEITPEDLVDENGNLKKGLEIFDFNKDGKLDDIEKNYFATGGRFIKTDSNKITVANFISSLEALDLFDESRDGKLTGEDKNVLHKYITATYQMLDGLENISPEVRDLYVEALLNVKSIHKHSRFDMAGYYAGGQVGITDFKSKKAANIMYTMVHELTHHLNHALSDKNPHPITQEVQTFYMEYKLYEQNKNNPLFTKPNADYQHVLLMNDYESLRKGNPDISELDIAKFAFMNNYYSTYAREYGEWNPDLVYKSDYTQIGDIFAENKNKKDIYRAGIEKAFSGLELKDENGKNLITEELKNLFSPEKPIITYKDLIDKNGNLKKGLELFDLNGNGNITNEPETLYFRYITYNDIPRIVKILDKYKNTDKQTNSTQDSVSTTAERKLIAQEIATEMRFDKKFDFHID